MENKSGNAQGASEEKSSSMKETVVLTLFQLERAFCRMGEMPLPKDMRDPMHEVLSRLLASIYLVQSLVYTKPDNHDEVIDQASMFDDIEVDGLPLIADFRKAK